MRKLLIASAVLMWAGAALAQPANILPNVAGPNGYQPAAPAALVTPAGALSPATPTLANVACSASSFQLFAANPLAAGRIIFNDAAQIVTVKFGAVASATSLTVKLADQTAYAVPFNYSGVVTAICPAATGTVRTTELQ